MVVADDVFVVLMLVVSLLLFSRSWHIGGLGVTAVFSNDWLGSFIRLCKCVRIEKKVERKGKMRKGREKEKDKDKTNGLEY